MQYQIDAPYPAHTRSSLPQQFNGLSMSSAMPMHAPMHAPRHGHGHGGHHHAHHGHAQKTKNSNPAELFVGNLSYFCTERELFELFEEAGNVQEARVIMNDSGTRSLAFGFVTMCSVHEARESEKLFNGQYFMGRKIRVATAEKRYEFKNAAKEGVQMHVAFSSFFSPNEPLVRPTEAFLRKVFTRFGVIVDVAVKEYNVYADQAVQEGYGFVSFDCDEAVLRAVQACTSVIVQGVTLKCTLTHSLSVHEPRNAVNANVHVLANGGGAGNAFRGGRAAAEREMSLSALHRERDALLHANPHALAAAHREKDLSLLGLMRERELRDSEWEREMAQFPHLASFAFNAAPPAQPQAQSLSAQAAQMSLGGAMMMQGHGASSAPSSAASAFSLSQGLFSSAHGALGALSQSDKGSEGRSLSPSECASVASSPSNSALDLSALLQRDDRAPLALW